MALTHQQRVTDQSKYAPACFQLKRSVLRGMIMDENMLFEQTGHTPALFIRRKCSFVLHSSESGVGCTETKRQRTSILTQRRQSKEAISMTASDTIGVAVRDLVRDVSSVSGMKRCLRRLARLTSYSSEAFVAMSVRAAKI